MTLDELFSVLQQIERTARIERQLPPDHVTEWNHFPFTFAKKQVDRFAVAAQQYTLQQPDLPGGFAANAFAQVLVGDYAAADTAMARFQELKPSDPIARMRFAVRPALPLLDLPDVVGDWPTHPALFVACDPEYYRMFALSFMRSLATATPGARLHLHLMGEAQRLPPEIDLNISMTSENPAAFLAQFGISAPHYYHAARIARLAEALEAAACLVMVDIDSLVMQDMASLLEEPLTGLRVRPGRIEPWNQFSACIMRGTTQSLPYFKAAADIVRRMIGFPFWGLDQYALFAAALPNRPDIRLFGPDVVSVTEDVPGMFWMTAGKKKSDLLVSPSPFAKAYRTFM